MRNAGGYSIITEPGQRDVEHDTYTCGHCGSITFTVGEGNRLQVAVIKGNGNIEMRDAGFCRKCWRHICPRCIGFKCTPFEAKIEQEEAEANKRII